MIGKDNKVLNIIRTHRHSFWILTYVAVYMIGFHLLESAGHVHYHIIHTWLDEQIPFCEYFIIPYFLWFGFNVAVVTWIVFKGTVQETYKVSAVLMMGMTIFLVVSLLYPNRLDLRPDYVDTSNICGMLVALLYKIDTPTNVLPSIHVFNTMALCFAVHGNRQLREKKLVTLASDILGVLIILSTMFLKQHSVIDVSLGLVMSVMLQMIGDRIFETPAEQALAEERAYGRRSGQVTD